jgi:hypothetical protein
MPSEVVNNFLENELERLEVEFKRRLLEATKGLSDIEAVQLVKELNFYTELQNAGLSDIINQIEEEYAQIISDAIKQAEKVGAGIRNINLTDLEILVQEDTESLLNSAKAYANQFKSRLIKGFISGEDTASIVSSLDNIGLRTNQVISAVNTARDQFNSTALMTLFEDEPDTHYVMNHVIDGRTRCSCKAVFFRQPKEGYTRKQIQEGNAWHKLAMSCPDYAKRWTEGKQAKYNIVNRGSYGCRGIVEVV